MLSVTKTNLGRFGFVIAIVIGVPYSAFAATTGTAINSSYTELSKLHNGCTQSNAFGGDCNAAINRYCQSKGYVSGFGPTDHYQDSANFVCVASAAAQQHTTYSNLSAYHNGCSANSGVSNYCNAAINRYCQSLGYESGFGPNEHSGDNAVVTCVSSSMMKTIEDKYSAFSSYHSGCTSASSSVDSCNSAINGYCSALGYLSGFGPIEIGTSSVSAACVTSQDNAKVIKVKVIVYTNGGTLPSGWRGSIDAVEMVKLLNNDFKGHASFMLSNYEELSNSTYYNVSDASSALKTQLSGLQSNVVNIIVVNKLNSSYIGISALGGGNNYSRMLVYGNYVGLATNSLHSQYRYHVASHEMGHIMGLSSHTVDSTASTSGGYQANTFKCKTFSTFGYWSPSYFTSVSYTTYASTDASRTTDAKNNIMYYQVVKSTDRLTYLFTPAYESTFKSIITGWDWYCM